MNKINREYDFTGEDYYFKVNEELMSKYEVDDIEEFIIQNQLLNIGEIKVKLQQRFDINNSGSYFILWDKLHKLYTEDIIEWQGEDPFEDMYQYSGTDFKFKIDVSLNKDYQKYRMGIFSALARDYDEYEENINKVSDNPLTNLIFVYISNNEEIVGRITFLLGINKKSYIIGNIHLKENISSTVLKNAFLWSGSRLCLIFGQICNVFEFRIEEKYIDSYEVKKLFECGFEAQSINHFGKKLILLKKNI